MSIWALVREVSNGLFIQDHHRHRTQHPRSNARHLRTARSLSLEIKQPLSHWKIREDPWNIEKTLHNILKTYNEKHETSNFESKCSFMTIYVFDVFDSFGPYKTRSTKGIEEILMDLLDATLQSSQNRRRRSLQPRHCLLV